MADRIFDVPVFTPTAQADGGALTNATYMALIAGTALQGLLVKEIYVGGAATSSTVNTMLFARTSTIGVTPTALAAPNSDGPKNGFSTATSTVAKSYVAAATGPFRSATTTIAKLNLTHNAFGGVVKWQGDPNGTGGYWMIFGVTLDISESVLSCITNGGGAVGSHIIYEVLVALLAVGACFHRLFA